MYTIVFEDAESNAGDQPMLTPSDTFTGTGSIRVSIIAIFVSGAALLSISTSFSAPGRALK